jgi:F420-0:gamma-glutamyl ligase
MIIRAVKTGIFKEKQNLADFVCGHIPEIKDKSVIAVSSKIAALAQGRTAPRRLMDKLIKNEAQYYKKTALCYFTIKDAMVMTNAGIDRSNIKDKISLLPKDPYKTADDLRKILLKRYKVKNLGIIITDSMILPLRAGVITAAIAYSGFKGVKNYIGKKDIYGRKLKMTLVDAADSLAAAAGVTMGEGAEKTPLAVIEDAPVRFINETNPGEIKYPLKRDLYYPFFKTLTGAQELRRGRK